MEGLFPLDQGENFEPNAMRIFRSNVDLMRRADAGLFNLTPFRGPSADAGTVFEMGLMFAQDKPVFGYTADKAFYADRVAAVSVDDAEMRRWDKDGYEIEDFQLFDNLMIVGAIRDSGGDIAIVEEFAEPTLAAFDAFEASLAQLRKYFGI